MEFKPLLKMLPKVDTKELLKNFFQQDFGEKDVELIVNGLAKRLTPDLQSTLILSLVKYRNREITEIQAYLNELTQGRDELISNILESTEINSKI